MTHAEGADYRYRFRLFPILWGNLASVYACTKQGVGQKVDIHTQTDLIEFNICTKKSKLGKEPVDGNFV